MPDYDLTVIGSGPGGYVAAIHAARLGARVAILEQKDTEWGGTCLNWGCIPTKALIHGAEVFQTVRRAAEFGVRVPEPEIDWPVMQGRKDRVVEAMRKGVQGLLKANGVEMITARGRLGGGTRVSAEGRAELGLGPAGPRLGCRPAPGAGRRAGADQRHHPRARPRARVADRDRRWSGRHGVCWRLQPARYEGHGGRDAGSTAGAARPRRSGSLPTADGQTGDRLPSRHQTGGDRAGRRPAASALRRW